MPESLLCLPALEVLREAGTDSDLVRAGGVGVFLADPGALHTCGFTGTTWAALLFSELLDHGLIFFTGFLDGPEELGV